LFVDITFPGKLRLDGVAFINGSLVAGVAYSPTRLAANDGINNYATNDSSTLTEISFANLTNIDRHLYITSIPSFTNISIPNLSSARDYVWLQDLVTFFNLDLGTGPSVTYYMYINGTGL
jgi:hypothetical protein